MNRISLLLFLAILCILLSPKSHGQSENLSIVTLLGSNQILVIGESYGQIESADFFSKSVIEYVNGGTCLKVGLEIPSDQQETLDRAMRGEVSMSEVEIDNVVDHDHYREMLVNFSELIISGKCLSVHAINPPSSIPMTKDAWMEQQVVKIIDDKPIAILVENKHAVKDFNIADDSERKLLAQRLRSRSLGVSSVLQYWKTGYCNTKIANYSDTETDKKSAIYVKQAIGEISAAMPEKVSMVSDGVIVWGCERIKVTEIDSKSADTDDRKIIIEISKYELVKRDEEALKKIRWGIKNNYPALGMTKEEAIEALGEPKTLQKAGDFEKWSYECSDEDGFYYICFILKFREGIIVNYEDLV